jgi:D-Tyr-tRNAtyr deacylase
MSSSRKPRRCKPKKTEVSSAWYVGYTEDTESVESIMRKFEELEKMKQDLPQEDTVLNQSQLEYLFVRTSAFTVYATLSKGRRCSSKQRGAL